MVDVEIVSAYNRYLRRREPRTKIIKVGPLLQRPFQLVVGLGYHDVCRGGLSLLGGRDILHSANIAVILRNNGTMKIVKNRYGSVTNNYIGDDNFSVRSAVLHSLLAEGYSEIDSLFILGNFNSVVRDLIPSKKLVKDFYLLKHKIGNPNIHISYEN